MFKKATIFGFNPKAFPAGLTLPQEQIFTPPGSLELQRSGWSPVREDQLIYTQGLNHLLHFTIEGKILPGSVINQVAKAKAAELEETQGFPPGKKAMKDLKERAHDELLPRAFPKVSVTRVWIDRGAGRIVVESVATSVLDLVKRALYNSLGDIGMCDVAWPRAKVLTEWVDSPPVVFALDDAVTLAYPGSKQTVVKFAKADLGSGEVFAHVQGGAVVQALAVTYDSRISFTLTDNMQLRGIKPLDILKEGREAENNADRFDNDFSLMTLEMSKLITALGKEA